MVFLFFLSQKNNSPGVSQGSTNREENEKCISVNKLTKKPHYFSNNQRLEKSV